jgi:hypothetical protein
MNWNGAHPYKPRGFYCYLGPLMKWTGWGKKRINYYVETGRLRVNDERHHRLFVVEDAQQIIEESLSAKHPNSSQ